MPGYRVFVANDAEYTLIADYFEPASHGPGIFFFFFVEDPDGLKAPKKVAYFIGPTAILETDGDPA